MTERRGVSDTKGLTLIEVLIVTSIIAILASIVLVGIGSSQRTGRDAQRFSDIEDVRKDLNLYFNQYGHYPTTGNSDGNADCANGGLGPWSQVWSKLSSCLINSNIGVGHIPNDPNGSFVYAFMPVDSGARFLLGATIEVTSTPMAQQTYTGFPCDGTSHPNPGQPSFNYCVIGP